MTDDKLILDLRDSRFDGQLMMRASAANRIEELEEAIYEYVNAVVMAEGVAFIGAIPNEKHQDVINETWKKLHEKGRLK